ncbi:MAG: hypothetical protein NVSMB25_06630 [Thermoleophilaceae bacterium]
MITFCIDLWQDLREKRLWPVAVGLIAAIVAIPFILFKPVAAGPQQQLPTVSTRPTVARFPIVTVTSGPSGQSKLDSFEAHNPFHPLSDVTSAPAAASGPKTAALGPSASAPKVRVASAPSTATSRATAPVTTPAAPSSRSRLAAPATSTKMVYFRFSPEIRFGTPGSLKTLKRVKLLSLLPTPKQPILAFMGISSDYRSATFFLSDPGFQATGKSSCNATGVACRFIKLTLDGKHGSETFVSTDGRTRYDLKLLRIDREALTPAQAKGRSTDVRPRAKSAGARRLLKNLLTLSSLFQQSTTSAAPQK